MATSFELPPEVHVRSSLASAQVCSQALSRPPPVPIRDLDIPGGAVAGTFPLAAM